MIKLEECNILKSEIEYGELGINCNAGYDIIVSVNNNSLCNYISAHPKSQILFELPENSKFFTCKVGLNDSSDNLTSADFEIKVDGQTKFISKNVKKHKVQNVEIFLNENENIELICNYNNSSICHALWIEPCVHFEEPKYSICPFNTTLINNKCKLNEKFDKCIACYFDKNNFSYFVFFHNQIQKYTDEKIKFVVFCENWIEEHKEFISSNDIHVIEIKNKNCNDTMGFLNKSALYTVANYINAEKYLLIDVDIIPMNDVKLIFDEVKSEDTIYVTRDAHTDGLSFGDIICENWSAYVGTHDCKNILQLNPSEINNDFIMNSGVIAGKSKAIFSFYSELCKMLPLSEFYFKENPKVGLREQAVANLAVIKQKDYEVLHKKYNLQVLWEEINISLSNNKLEALSGDFEPLFVHFNGPAAKEDLKKLINCIENNIDFEYEKHKFGKYLDKFLDSEEVKILDLQTNETLIESFARNSSRKFEILKISPDKKNIIRNNSFSESRIEDLYFELKKIISSQTFDVSLISNLDNYHNILTKLIMSLRCSKYICFNEYNFGHVKIEDILEYLNAGEAKLVQDYEENPNQKIYVLENSWN